VKGDNLWLEGELWARVEQLLGDRGWHSYEQVAAELGKAIPPGIALRAQEKRRLRGSGPGRRGPAQRAKPLTVDQLIDNGRRIIVVALLKGKQFETDRPGNPGQRVKERRIRLVGDPRARPGGCPADVRGHDYRPTIGPRGGKHLVCACGRFHMNSRQSRRRTQ